MPIKPLITCADILHRGDLVEELSHDPDKLEEISNFEGHKCLVRLVFINMSQARSSSTKDRSAIILSLLDSVQDLIQYEPQGQRRDFLWDLEHAIQEELGFDDIDMERRTGEMRISVGRAAVMSARDKLGRSLDNAPIHY